MVASSSLVKGFGFPVMGVVFLGMFVALLAVTVRRLHDTGWSGWWYLLNFVPLGSLVVLVFLVEDSKITDAHGPNPKAPPGVCSVRSTV